MNLMMLGYKEDENQRSQVLPTGNESCHWCEAKNAKPITPNFAMLFRI
jgi:hypothetical protein